MKYNYSLIIPHYNIPNLLERLLRTVPKREDLQVIVVDDCSLGEVQIKLEKIKIEFPHVEFYSTGINGGGGKARNVGLKHALGKYVFFADADDFFLPSIYDILSDYENSDADIIYLNAGSCDTNTYSPSDRNQFLNYCHDLHTANPELANFKFRYTFGEPWCKIIKRQIVVANNIRFHETPCYNDTYFSYMVGHYAKTIITDSRIIYIVTYRNDSVVNTNMTNRYQIMMYVFLEKEKFFIDNNIKEHAYPLYDCLISDIFHFNLKNIHKIYTDLCSQLPSKFVRRVTCKRFIKRIQYFLNGKQKFELLN